MTFVLLLVVVVLFLVFLENSDDGDFVALKAYIGHLILNQNRTGRDDASSPLSLMANLTSSNSWRSLAEQCS